MTPIINQILIPKGLLATKNGHLQETLQVKLNTSKVKVESISQMLLSKLEIIAQVLLDPLSPIILNPKEFKGFLKWKNQD